MLFEEEGGQGGGGGGTAAPTQPEPTQPEPGQQQQPGSQQQPGGGTTMLNNPGGGGQPQSSFKDMLPEDLKNSTALQDIKTVQDLAKSFVHAQSMVGKNRLPAPDDNWSDKDWDHFYDQLGRPKSPDEYPDADVELPKEMDQESVTEIEKRLKKNFHKAGLTPKQSKAVLNELRGVWNEGYNDSTKAQEQAEAQRIETLKKEFGDDLSIALDSGKQMLDKFADDDFTQFLEETRLGNDARMVRFLNKVASAVSEDSPRVGQGGSGFRTGTPSQAKTELGQLMQDKNFQEALYNETHKDHKWAVEKRMSLLRQMSE